jgi:hypothetical protein
MPSSYDRINDKYLVPHKETRDFVANFPNCLGKAEIVGHSFHVNHNDGTITTSLQCLFGEKPEEETEEGPTTHWTVEFTGGTVHEPTQQITGSFCSDLLDRVWGKPKICPTFNCKQDGVGYRFSSSVVREIREKHKDAIEEEVVRVQNLATAYMARPEFVEEKKATLERGGKDEIIAAMERFSVVSEDVVRDAVEEYLAKRVVNE